MIIYEIGESEYCYQYMARRTELSGIAFDRVLVNVTSSNNV